MKQPIQGVSLLTGDPISFHVENLPHRYRIKDLSERSPTPYPAKTLGAWFWLGGCAALMTLCLWLGA